MEFSFTSTCKPPERNDVVCLAVSEVVKPLRDEFTSWIILSFKIFFKELIHSVHLAYEIN